MPALQVLSNKYQWFEYFYILQYFIVSRIYEGKLVLTQFSQLTFKGNIPYIKHKKNTITFLYTYTEAMNHNLYMVLNGSGLIKWRCVNWKTDFIFKEHVIFWNHLQVRKLKVDKAAFLNLNFNLNWHNPLIRVKQDSQVHRLRVTIQQTCLIMWSTDRKWWWPRAEQLVQASAKGVFSHLWFNVLNPTVGLKWKCEFWHNLHKLRWELVPNLFSDSCKTSISYWLEG